MLTIEQLVVGGTYEFKLNEYGKKHAIGVYVGVGKIELDTYGDKCVRYSNKYVNLNLINHLSYDIEVASTSANTLFNL